MQDVCRNAWLGILVNVMEQWELFFSLLSGSEEVSGVRHVRVMPLCISEIGCTVGCWKFR